MVPQKYLLTLCRFLIILLFIGTHLFSPYYAVAEIALATISMSGDIPVVFQMNTFGTSGELDLTARAGITNRVVGQVHLKYNINLASYILQSDTATGLPEKAGVAYVFGATPFQIAVGPCTTIDPAKVPLTPANLAAGATDIKSAASAALVGGVEEDCNITASWSGTNAGLSLSGVYSIQINITMTSI